MSNTFEIIPLGGIGEFGMNCMVVRHADEMIIIDAGKKRLNRTRSADV